ncbi:hypothetical protein FBY21_1541 [Pseudomonas sp. SLBN-26]|uniref:hypothetical protein n=1 Tax=Pseudomonadaceae TaxID=135621 RepID=UPI00114D5028|nr:MULTISPECIES: hypothetical protein [Pseudomonas]MCP1616942.1 hypothetical protein [Pseudomonas otitidis]TQL06187.1 hypothetical protein FBY21_1541 [Pseudomonas sp. SLBN-26]
MAIQNPYKPGSIAGDTPLATQKAKGISPLPGVMPIGAPSAPIKLPAPMRMDGGLLSRDSQAQTKPSPLRLDGGIQGYQPPAPEQRYGIGDSPVPGNPARAKAMQAQYDQPVMKGIPQGGIGGGAPSQPAAEQPHGNGFLRGLAEFGNGIVNTTVGGAEALLAGPLDWGRNGITSLSGGDPQSLPGGPTAFRDTANRRLSTGLGQLGGTASAVGDTALATLGANRRDGSDPSVPHPAGIGGAPSVAQKQSPSDGGIVLPAAEPVKVESNGIGGFGETGIAGVVGRRGANGVMEFSNDPNDVAGAKGKAGGGIGDGIGTLSIMSGGAEGMQRNLAAAEIIRQTRRDNAGGGLSIVGDSTRGRGLDQQQAERVASANWDRQQQAKLEARQAGGIAGGLDQFFNNQLQRQATEQQIAARGLELQKQERLNGLLAGLDDQSRSPEERAQLREAYLQMTTPLKDQRTVSLGEVVDPATGQKFKSPLLVDLVKGTSTRIDGGQQSPTITPQQLADLDEVTQDLAKKPGINSQDIKRLNERRQAANLKPLPVGGA